MKNFAVYFAMQIKRVMKIFPTIICTMLLLCGVMGFSMVMFMDADGTKENKLKVKVGVVGEIDNYMGFDIYSMLQVLSSRFGMEFVSVSEEEAREAMRDGSMSAYVLVPENLVASLVSGENNKQITYVASEGQKGLSSIIMDEVVAVISELITCPQSSIFGMQGYLSENGREEEIWPATEKLNIIYIGALMDIMGMGDLEITGMANHVTTTGYYACSILIIFLLLSGMNCSSLFAKKKTELCKLLVSKGQKVSSQVLGEYLAYFLLMFVFLGIVMVTVFTLAAKEILLVPEWEGANSGEFFAFLLQFILVAAVITAMQFLLYELVQGVVSSILVQFLCAVAMGYVAGCYYPLYFFPKALQIIGGLTPVGISLRYANKCLVGDGILAEAGLLLLYLAGFLLLTIWVRKRRVQNESGL